MANRPVFTADDRLYVNMIYTEFEFHNGFSAAQRQRSSESLHKAFERLHPEARILEVSSFSKEEVGTLLSAFNLHLSLKNGERVPVESAFQGGKIFENGGPYKDLVMALPKEAKRDARLRESGRIIGFDFDGQQFSTEPATLFYTWLYLKALQENPELAEQVLQYDAFTDIVFNPDKSINCQAYACAVYVSLQRKNELAHALTDIGFLADILRKAPRPSGTGAKAQSAKKKVIPIPEIVYERPGRTDEEKEGSAFHVGDRIKHPKYGEGTVVRTETAGSAAYLFIQFDSLDEEKKLAEKWARKNLR